jgi:hypothetical protein
VKFTIELYTTGADGDQARLSSTTFSALTPLAARKEAVRRLAALKKPVRLVCSMPRTKFFIKLMRRDTLQAEAL